MFPTNYREVYVFVKILGSFRAIQCLDCELTAKTLQGIIEAEETRDYPHANPIGASL